MEGASQEPWRGLSHTQGLYPTPNLLLALRTDQIPSKHLSYVLLWLLVAYDSPHQVWWHVPVIPELSGAESGSLLQVQRQTRLWSETLSESVVLGSVYCHLTEMPGVEGRQGKNQGHTVGQANTTIPKDWEGWLSYSIFHVVS